MEEGDIVNVDYVGKLDGEAFSGGTAEDQILMCPTILPQAVPVTLMDLQTD
mgnify:CR=1 FL=1